MSDKQLNAQYFEGRNLNDELRLAAFVSEKELVTKYIEKGTLLDVGCSTGEMIAFYAWDGDAYGMEIVDYAVSEAKKRDVRFDRDLKNSADFFDVIIFRGTIQHIDTPLAYVKLAMQALRPGGYLFFLATPNADSIYFKLWKTLPFLDMPNDTYFIPHEKWFIQAVENFGFILREKRFPYIRSPYARPLRDHLKFLLKLFGARVKFPFWKNSMELAFQKPTDN